MTGWYVDGPIAESALTQRGDKPRDEHDANLHPGAGNNNTTPAAGAPMVAVMRSAQSFLAMPMTPWATTAKATIFKPLDCGSP